MKVRLQKFLAESGIGARRSCERLILEGKVFVNGTAETVLGTKIDPDTDLVSVGKIKVTPEPKVYIALNKPRGVICTSKDTEGRKRAIDLIPKSIPRVYTVGRLDMDSDGLLIFTNDGNFCLRLSHPRHMIRKTYAVEVIGKLTDDTISKLLSGVMSDGQLLRAEKVYRVESRSDVTKLRIDLKEGKNRQIRRMMDSVGHQVVRLTRLKIGSISITNLKPSEWRYLTKNEIEYLSQQATVSKKGRNFTSRRATNVQRSN